MWHGARRSGKSGTLVTWEKSAMLGGSTFFFVLKASWLTFLAMGKTRISISKRMGICFRSPHMETPCISWILSQTDTPWMFSSQHYFLRRVFIFSSSALKIHRAGLSSSSADPHTHRNSAGLGSAGKHPKLGNIPKMRAATIMGKPWKTMVYLVYLADDSWLRGWLTLRSSNMGRRIHQKSHLTGAKTLDG